MQEEDGRNDEEKLADEVSDDLDGGLEQSILGVNDTQIDSIQYLNFAKK